MDGAWLRLRLYLCKQRDVCNELAKVYLYEVYWMEHGLKQGPRSGQFGMQNNDRGAHGVTAPQLLYEIVEALLSAAHDHMVCQVSNLLSTSYLPSA